MVIIKTNPHQTPGEYAVAAAHGGVIIGVPTLLHLPPYADLLIEVHAGEKIKAEKEITAADMVTVPAEAWQAAVGYITALHDCGTCKHAPKCKDPDCFFAECTVAGCACRTCLNGSAWEWRHSRGKA